MDRIFIFLQARMGSKRLPGKVLKPLWGRPMIAWILDRLAKSSIANRIVVLIPDKVSDDPLACFLNQRNDCSVFRGSEIDVLDRFYRAAIEWKADHVVRCTADNPFVDPFEMDAMIGFHLSRGFDYTCSFPMFGANLPIGVGAEIFRLSALERSWREGGAPHHREHVNEFIYEHRNEFRFGVYRGHCELRERNVALTVDDETEFSRAEQIYSAFYSKNSSQTYLPVSYALQYLDVR